MDKSLIRIKDYYEFNNEKQLVIAREIGELCLDLFNEGFSINLCKRKVQQKTGYQLKVIDYCIRSNHGLVELFNEKHKITRKIRKAKFFSIQIDREKYEIA